jgi:hypothetical protein
MFLWQLSDHINSQYYINNILFYSKMSNSIFSKRTSQSHPLYVVINWKGLLIIVIICSSHLNLSLKYFYQRWMNGRIFPFRSEKNFTWINTWGYFVNEIITFHLDCILIQSENLAKFQFFSIFFKSLNNRIFLGF